MLGFTCCESGPGWMQGQHGPPGSAHDPTAIFRRPRCSTVHSQTPLQHASLRLQRLPPRPHTAPASLTAPTPAVDARTTPPRSAFSADRRVTRPPRRRVSSSNFRPSMATSSRCPRRHRTRHVHCAFLEYRRPDNKVRFIGGKPAGPAIPRPGPGRRHIGPPVWTGNGSTGAGSPGPRSHSVTALVEHGDLEGSPVVLLTGSRELMAPSPRSGRGSATTTKCASSSRQACAPPGGAGDTGDTAARMRTGPTSWPAPFATVS